MSRDSRSLTPLVGLLLLCPLVGVWHLSRDAESVRTPATLLSPVRLAGHAASAPARAPSSASPSLAAAPPAPSVSTHVAPWQPAAVPPPGPSPSPLDPAAFHFQAPSGRDAVVEAGNPIHGFTTILDPRQPGRTTIKATTDVLRLSSPETPLLSWELTSAGYGGTPPPSVAVTSPPTTDAAEARWSRPGLVEWLRQGESGLEHGFTLAHRLASPEPETPDEPLRLILTLETPLTPHLESSPGHDRLLLSHPDTGESLLAYEKLYVTDATGRELPSRLEWAEDSPATAAISHLALVIHDRDAVYPVIVDPTLVSVPVTGWDGAAESSASPRGFTTFGPHVYFSAGDPVYGRELWKTDGTGEGTIMVADLAPGILSSEPTWFVVVGDKLFFRATDWRTSRQVKLWVTDGTTEGTRLARDVPVGNAPNVPADYAVLDGVLYFSGNDGASGAELWRSDGTESGTWRVKDIREGESSSNPTNFVRLGNEVFFRATTDSGTALWKSDGTESGTLKVSNDIPWGLAAWKSDLYYVTTDVSQAVLWRSDGTEGGTSIVRNWTETPTGFSYDSLVATEQHLFFTFGGQPWRTDGTSEGTLALKNLWLYKNGLEPNICALGNTAYFVAAPPAASGEGPPVDYELWKSDGTVEGTVLVKDIIPGSQASFPYNFFAFNNEVYFHASDRTHGLEWWKTDGTDEGTVLVKDIHPGSGTGPSSPGNSPAILGSNFIFRARAAYSTNGNDANAQAGVWKSNGTAVGTVLVKDTSAFTGSNPPAPIWAVFGDKLAFVRSDAAAGSELWITGDNADSTLLLKDINPGAPDGAPERLFPHEGTLYFSATNPTAGRELWKTDGTPTGTILLKDINPGPAHGNPRNFFPFASSLFFSANDGVHGGELWKTDGTSKGTFLLKDLLPGLGSGAVSAPVIYKDALYFLALWNDGQRGLWTSDGTEAGTRLVSHLNETVLEESLSLFGDKLLFSAYDEAHGTEWWESDGTTEGTRMILDAAPGPDNGAVSHGEARLGDSLVYYHRRTLSESDLKILNANGQVSLLATMQIGDALHTVGGVVCFSGRANQSSFYELWKTDGTVAGTGVLKIISQVPSSHGLPQHFFPAGNYLYFTANDGIHGRELWRTDGTPDGTVRLTDVFPPEVTGYLWANPVYLLDHEGILYFTAADDRHGRELWQTDGTPEGTKIVEDLAPGFGSSFPTGMIAVGDTLYYSVLDDGTGQGAIRKLVPAAPPPFTGGILTTVTGEAAWLTFAELLAGLAEGVTMQEVAATSAAGGVITREATGLRYTPPAGHRGADSFSVTLSDGQQGVVTVTVHPAEWLAEVAILSRTAEELRLRFHSTTGREVIIERSADLREWEAVATATADGAGVLLFTDAPPPTGTAYYRLTDPVP